MVSLISKPFADQRSNAPIWLAAIGLVYLASRLYHLTILPIFLDESLHIFWALEIAESGNWLAGDGARLLPVWILRLLLPFAGSILFGGRLAAVFVGLAAGFGCYLTGQSLFNRRVGLIAFALYVLNPFTLNNDRLLVMTDVLLVVWTTLTVWISLKLVKTRPGWGPSALLGLILGLVILTNLRGILIWGLPLLAAALWGRAYRRKLSGYLLLAYAIALLLSAPVWWILQTGLRASQGVSLAGNPASTWVAYWGQNLGLLAAWLAAYVTPGLGIALIAALVLTVRQRPRVGLLLVGWSLTFTMPWVLVAESWLPRYILPAFPAFFILLGYLADMVWQKISRLPQNRRRAGLAAALAVALILLWPLLYFDYWQLHNPAQAPYPRADRFQYIEGWPSGYGVFGVVESLQAQVEEKGDIFVAVDRDVFKLMGQLAFEAWQEGEHPIHLLDIKDQRISTDEIYQQLSLSPLPVYWVAGDDNGPEALNRELLARVEVEPIASFARPGNQSHLYVYHLSAKDNK